MDEVLAVAHRVLHRARAGWKLEAYVEHRITTTVQAGTSAAIRHVGRAETRGLGVRAVQGDHVGYASTADLSDPGLDKAVSSAQDNALAGDTDPAGAVLPKLAAALPVEALARPALVDMPLAAKLDFVTALARRATSMSLWVRRIDTAQWRDDVRSVAVASTVGTSGCYNKASAELWVDVLGEDESAGQTAEDYAYWWGRDPTSVDVEELAASAVRRVTRLLGASAATSHIDTVVLDPAVSAFLFEAVGRGLTGGALANRRSPFSGRFGEEVAAPLITLVDDGRSVDAPAAAPFDDEGVPRRCTPLIVAGVLTGALHSTATAESSGDDASSTGNAQRATHKAAPRAAPSTLRLEPYARADVDAGSACYVQQISGSVAGISSVTGRVSLGGVGYRIVDGEPAGRLPTLPIATTLQSLLREIVAVGDDAVVVPDSPVLAPTITWRPARGLPVRSSDAPGYDLPL